MYFLNLYNKIKWKNQSNTKKGFFFYLIGEGISKGIVFLSIPFFINALSKEEFGRLSLYWISLPLLSIFFDFSQRSFVKYFYLQKSEKLGQLLSTLNFFISRVFVFYLIVFIIKDQFSLYLVDEISDFVLLLSASFYAMIEVNLSFYQIKGYYKKYNILFILRNALPYLLGIFFIYTFWNSVYTFVLIQMLVLCLIVIFIFNESKRKNENRLKSLKLLKESLNFSLPIIPALLSALLLSFSDRFIINYFNGEEAVADYTVAYTIGSGFAAFFLATNKMWQKFILENLKLNNFSKIKETAKKYLLIIIVLGLMLIFLSKYIILIISNESYASANDLVIPIIIGMFFYFLYTLYSNIPFFYSNSKFLAIPAIIAAILNISLNIVFIPKYGIIAAAYTTAISYFVQFVVLYIICVKKYNIDILFNVRR